MFRPIPTIQLAVAALAATVVGFAALTLAGVDDAHERGLLAGCGVGICALVVILGVERRRLHQRLESIAGLLGRVAAGEFDGEISRSEEAGLGSLTIALSDVVGRLRENGEALHRSRMLIDAAPVNLLLCDREHAITSMNPACRVTLEALRGSLGLPEGELLGASIAFLFESAEDMHGILEDEHSLPHRATHRRGEEHLDVTVDVIRGLDGERAGSLLTFSVVTEEHRNRVRLHDAVESERESADRLRAAIDRERERADADGEVATELRLKADRISEVVVAAANGDLSQRVGLLGDSPMDQIAVDLDQFLDDLAGRVQQIREMSSQLAEAGHQLDAVGKNLVTGASRTTDEVGSVVRAWTATSEGVDGIHAQIEGLAERFQGIVEDSRNASQVVEAGVGAANEARRSIEELDRSTEEIQIVLTVIDQIADQSKLLALNASIEAARAGESGRGFNVVAQEVRKLASRTEEATRHIASTVAQILERGDRSAVSIRAMGDVMDRVEKSQGLIARTMSAQQTATDEMRTLADQVNDRSRLIAASIEHLSQVAESAEEDAAGTNRESHRLLELANQIGELTSRFVC
ncbi:MAG: methyl-accepting chemotaxis protein [Myxococcota bacterium]